MDLSTIKNFAVRATEVAGFTNQTGEPRLNVEGVVQIADSEGVLTDGGGGGGSSVGGGNNTYSNANGDFIATITNATKNITITGLPFTLENIHVANGSVKKIAVTTNDVSTLRLSNIAVSGGVITLADEDNFATGDVVVVTLVGPDKAYDKTLDDNKVVVQNPQYGHYTSVETLVSEDDPVGTNLTADAGGSATSLLDATGAFSVASTAVGFKAWSVTEGTSATISAILTTGSLTTGAGVTDWSTDEYQLPLVKRYEINMEGYNYLALHYRMTCVANQIAYLQLFGTLDASATVDADTNWVDMSTALLGGASISQSGAGTTEGLKYVVSQIPMLKYMVKMVWEKATTGAPSGSLFTVFVKKSS